MAETTLLEFAKTNLRIVNVAFDDNEIKPLIDACKLDLQLAGVNIIDETDSLIKRAIILYLKGNFGFSDDSEKYISQYEKVKNALALSSNYGGDVVV